jgi:hypothetical protein
MQTRFEQVLRVASIGVLLKLVLLPRFTSYSVMVRVAIVTRLKRILFARFGRLVDRVLVSGCKHALRALQIASQPASQKASQANF